MAKQSEKIVNGYGLTRSWFDFSFENQDLVTPSHTAMFVWFVELNNRMGWASKFAAPASQTMAAIGLKSYNTYKKVFDDLLFFGVIKLIKPSKNQYTSCIIALSNFDKALYKALDKALMMHTLKQSESTIQSNDSINKQLNNETNKPQTLNKKVKKNISASPTHTKKNRTLSDFKELAKLSFEENKCDFGNDFKIEWLKLIQSKKWKLKEQSAINASLKLLMKYDEVFAQSLVEKAIAGEYQGVVFTDTENHYQKFKNQSNGISKNITTADKTQSRNRMVELAYKILSNDQPQESS